MQERFLYRALRQEEINAGNILIPKGQGPFVAEPRLGIDTRLSFVLGPTEKYAVRQHQYRQNGFPTSGVSTTPHFERAKFYAQTNRVIVKIDRTLLGQYGVREFVVHEWLSAHPQDIAVPEDDEVILVSGVEGPFPTQIIVEVVQLK